MEFKKEKKDNVSGIKIVAVENGQEAGRAFLYLLKNDLHQEPFGFLEDVFVEAEYHKQGLGSQLVEKVIEEAKAQGCYKLIATSRSSKPELEKFYAKFGLNVWGVEFRKDL